ncbi:cysteine desulfurase family protein [Dinghuibacter silviterrae]|uniref:cysteine desulfurase n=1 Tax=Dinghuibacter silviterrae TaxID=1539049 RepID=A0A4R8DMW8_9BACT|nr:aminotransferase class V-fold PLP-dependent enzyme [Dinghuibacter silviterrae]TDW99349.1 cysteine desulfurase [Dinghuibacter silviterrae]
MLHLPVYLDHNATTPCDPAVVDAMLPYFTKNFGNAASRTHAFGWAAEEAVDLAREQVARLIGADPTEIVFTSGATESDNLALKGIFDKYRPKGNHLITCATEHKAVLDTCKHIEKMGGSVTYLPVDPQGRVDPAQVTAAIRPETILICIMYANNETGVLQPIREISAIARAHNIPFFTDATQAAGKIPIDVQEDGIDLLALSAHKFYGPKGTGALYVRRRNPRITLTPQLDGGGHERNFRSGTLNVPGIVGLGKAADICLHLMYTEANRLSVLRDHLEKSLLTLGDVFVNGSTTHRLPHVTNLSFRYIESQPLLLSIAKELALSSGSACTSANPEPSYVLKAMGLPDPDARASLRFSLGRSTTPEEITYAITHLSAAITRLRATSIR